MHKDLKCIGEIIDYVLRNGLSTPKRVYEALDIYFKRGITRYFIDNDGIEGIVLGSSGVHVVRISNEGYKCTCSDSYTNHYLCKHALALLYQVLNDKRTQDRALAIVLNMLNSTENIKEIPLATPSR